MEFADALQAVIDGYRSRAVELLAAYLLTPAVAQVARVVALAGMAGTYVLLAVSGRLARFRADVRAAEPGPPEPGADVEAYERWFEAVLPAVERLVTPEVLALLAITLVATVVVWTVLYAVATAAQLGCCWAVLRGDRGTTAAIRAAGRHWQPLLGLVVLQVAVASALTAVVVLPVAGLATVSPLAAVVVVLALGLPWLLALVALRTVFAFATVAVVVEDCGVTGGLRGAVGFARGNAGSVVGYIVAVVGVYVFIGSVAASGGGSASASGLLAVVVASPLLDLLKTVLYGSTVASIDPPESPTRSVVTQGRDGLARGLAELRRFVARHPGLHMLAAISLVGGAVGGWLLAGPYEGLVAASIEARLATHAPRTAVVTFSTNNIGVAISTAISGLAFGVPAAVSLLFNGAVLGVLARFEVAPLVLLAFVIPHGIVELPAFVVAGALGFALGADGWRAWRGRLDRPGLASSLERSVRVLVGIAVLLVVAGLIEGLVSPYYVRPILG